MMTRLLNSVGIGSKEPAPPPAMTAAPSPEAIDKPAPQAIASVPVPRTRPQTAAKAAPAPVVAKAPPAPPATDATATASTTAPAETAPAVGTFVKRRFIWPDDTGAAGAAGADTPG
jgi:outer membrane biosynthesis protein TonB